MPYLTPDASDKDASVFLVVPQSLVPHIIGAVSDLGVVWNWEGFGDVTPDEAVDMIGQALSGVNVDRYVAGYPNSYHQNIFMFSGMEGNWNVGWYPSSQTAMIDMNFGDDSGEWVEFDVPLSEGTWKITTYFVKWTNGGISTVTLDGVELGTFDCYKEYPTTYNNAFELTGVVVSESGDHSLRYTASTKNPLSAKYQTIVCDIFLERTGD